ncbi:MAG: ADOP family duplicated permease [Vicinamibacteraceae bacterium]
MSWFKEAWRRIRSIARRQEIEYGLDEEVHFHLDQQIEKNLRAGMNSAEARRHAMVRFGGMERVKEGTRDEFRSAFLEDCGRDVRYGLRALRRAPGFTLVASLMLALGIGATTAVFSVVHGVLIKPLPFPDADELVSLTHTATAASQSGEIPMSAALLATYRDETRTFQELGVWAIGGGDVTGLGDPERLESLWVSHGTLQALGVRPLIGRRFSEKDHTPGVPGTVILAYGCWQRRFGGDESVIGRRLMVNSEAQTVIGVMSKDFRFLDEDPDLIRPLRFDRKNMNLGEFDYQGLARLAPGVTLAQANADVARMIPIWLDSWPPFPGIGRGFFESIRLTPALRPLKEEVVGNVGSVLWVLMGSIGMVLLIACANVASLLLVRAEGRQQELAIRAALGAGRGRIARELLAESLVLGLFSGALGLALAFAALRVLIAVGPVTLPRLGEITIDPTVLVFALMVSVLSGLLFGCIPVAKHAGPQIARALRDSGRTSSASKERHRARNTLVIVQVALALMLLVGAGLMIRTFLVLRGVQPGFSEPDHVQLTRILITETQVADADRVFRMQQEMCDRIAAVPGVSAVAFMNFPPMEGGGTSVLYTEDQALSEGRNPPVRRFKFVSPGFFRVVGIPLVAGRDFTWAELFEHRPVAVISENLAREMWREPAAALGKRIRESTENPWREIIGVVGDVHDNGVHEPAPAIAYWPVLTENFFDWQIQAVRYATFAIRSNRAGTEAFLEELRSAVWSVNPDVPLAKIRTLGDVYERSLARTSFTLVMLAIAAGMALLLGIVGIYGVIAYAVSQRTREIGIRVALGARHEQLKRMFVRHGLVLATMGVVCGLAGAALLTRLMDSLLFGISPLDPMTYIVVSLGLVAAAVLASYVPAHRATAVDPVKALRAE